MNIKNNWGKSFLISLLWVPAHWSNRALAKAYWSHNRLDGSDGEDPGVTFWTVQRVIEKMDVGDMNSFRLLCEIAKQASTNEELSYVGAGAIENFLTNPSPDTINAFDTELQKNTHLRQAFQNTYLFELEKTNHDLFKRMSAHKDAI